MTREELSYFLPSYYTASAEQCSGGNKLHLLKEVEISKLVNSKKNSSSLKQNFSPWYHKDDVIFTTLYEWLCQNGTIVSYINTVTAEIKYYFHLLYL